MSLVVAAAKSKTGLEDGATPLPKPNQARTYLPHDMSQQPQGFKRQQQKPEAKRLTKVRLTGNEGGWIQFGILSWERNFPSSVLSTRLEEKGVGLSRPAFVPHLRLPALRISVTCHPRVTPSVDLGDLKNILPRPRRRTAPLRTWNRAPLRAPLEPPRSGTAKEDVSKRPLLKRLSQPAGGRLNWHNVWELKKVWDYVGPLSWSGTTSGRRQGRKVADTLKNIRQAAMAEKVCAKQDLFLNVLQRGRCCRGPALTSW